MLAAFVAVPLAVFSFVVGVIVLIASEQKSRVCGYWFVASLILFIGFILLLLSYGTLFDAENKTWSISAFFMVIANLLGLLFSRRRFKR